MKEVLYNASFVNHIMPIVSLRTIFGHTTNLDIFGQNLPKFSDIGRTRDRFFPETGTTSAKVNSVTNKSGMDVELAWNRTCRNILKNTLGRSDISRPECPSGRRTCNACSSGVAGKCTISGVVYCITCNLCTSDDEPVTYVSECNRPIMLRFSEHVLDAKKCFNRHSFWRPF